MNFRNINRPVVLLLVVLTISLVASGVFVGAAEEEQELHFGLVAHRVVNVWEALFANSFKWYCEDHGIKATVLEAKNDPSLQLTQIRRLVDMGADGIVVAAVESTAVIPAVEYAKEHGVPVVTANVDIYSPEVSIYVGFSGINASETLGKEIVNYLRDEVEPVGEVKGSILEVRGTIGSATGNDRHDGFAAVIEEYPDVEVFT